MEGVKRAKLILFYCAYYFVLTVFGGAVNSAVDADGQAFGWFLSRFIGGLAGVIIFAVFIMALTSLKQIKGKKALLSDTVQNFLITGIMLWIIVDALVGIIYQINTACMWAEYDQKYKMSDYNAGVLTLDILNFVGVVVLFVLLKFWKTIGAYFKTFGFKKEAAPAQEIAPAADDVKADKANPAEAIVVEETADIIEEATIEEKAAKKKPSKEAPEKE